MVDSAARVVRIRTTQDDGGPACGIVTGMGATPELALDELRHEAEGLAQQAGREANEVFEKAGPGGLYAAAKEKARKAAEKTGGWKPSMEERRSAKTPRYVHGPPEGAPRRKASGSGPPGVVPSWSRPAGMAVRGCRWPHPRPDGGRGQRLAGLRDTGLGRSSPASEYHRRGERLLARAVAGTTAVTGVTQVAGRRAADGRMPRASSFHPMKLELDRARYT